MTTSMAADIFLVPEGRHTSYRKPFLSVSPTHEVLASLGLSNKLRPHSTEPQFGIEQPNGVRPARHVVVRLNARVGSLRAGYYVLLRMSVEKMMKLAERWRR